MINLFRSQNIPKPVKTVAATFLMFTAFHFLYSFFFSPDNFAAVAALFKGLFGIAIAFGLLKLRAGWRMLSVFISGLSCVVLPIYFLAIIFSSDFVLFMTGLSGINSRVIIELILALGFVMFLWIYITLSRPDVKKAFESEKLESLAT